ncbi:Protein DETOXIFICATION 14 [Dichanthelium oligosanthes]|uniref:Protein DETOXIFICATION 14 n=1 Tax=Dichanthelium oligosanthes TaxID=888268 RepID=A0A1E5V684_9POAL|nr:Protein DETOXIFICATION 14 [Dichanthelium oligosanthes]
MGSSEAPLLLRHRPAAGKEDAEEGTTRRCCWWRCGGASGERWGEATAEAGRLASLAAPMIAVALLQLTMQLISTVMVGHLGEVPLAGAAIANSLTNVSGFSVLMGLASGLETICGQAYGAEQYHKLALFTYRSIIVLLVVSVPIAIIWVFIPDLLPLIGQDPQIASEAGRYALWLIPGLLAFSVAQCLSKFLQSQSLIFPMVLSSLTTLTVFIPLCWFMVYKIGMGNAGAALAVSICDWVEVMVLGLYIMFSPSCEKTRAPLTWEAFQGIGNFMRLAVPSALMICLEWWSYELLVLLSGILPNPALETSVLSICISTVVLVYNLPYGIGTAASNEAEVVDYVTRMVPLLSISVLTDNLQGVLSGGAGFWIGMIAGGATQVTLLSVITAMTNWGKMADKARDRVFEEILPTQAD